MRRRRLLATLLTAPLLAGCPSTTTTPTATTSPSTTSAARDGATAIPVPGDAQEATVVRITDGDTLVLRGRGVGPLVGGTDTKVRLLLIDTPELRPTPECGAREATAALAALAPKGSTVRVADDRRRLDRFGRTLLHVWAADGSHVNHRLLGDGHARVLVVRPNTQHLEALVAAESAARDRGTGIWACA